MIAAVVVVYCPNLALLDRLLQSVIEQVDRIFVIDNTPESSVALSSPFFERYSQPISYLPLGENKGIATAQNIGIRQSLNTGHSHVLLLDQDSALRPGMVDRLLTAERNLILAGKQVGAVGPLFIDEKTGKHSFGIRPGRFRVKRISLDIYSDDPVETEYLIASGSLIRMSVLNSIGLMKDELFIDWVDIEWGLRARTDGYRSFIVPKAIMIHSIGDATVRVFGKDINIHSDIRNYYMIRNATYMLRLTSMQKWRLITTIKILQYVVFYSLYSNHRWQNLNLFVNAVIHGIRGKLGRLTTADS